MNRRLGLCRTVITCCFFVVMAGCGGGRSGSSGGGGGGGGGGALPEPSFSGSGRSGTATAQFRVDLAKGTVDVTPLSGSASGRAAFSGAAVTFSSQLALDQAGSTGLRVVNVALNNHWGVPIGVDPAGNATGLRVVFSGFTNVTNLPDVRNQATVSTLPGTVGSPFGVAVAGDGTVFASSLGSYSLLQLSHGTVTKLAGSGSASYADGLGAGAAFAYPLGMAVSPADDAIYLADYNGRRVRRIERSGRVTTIAGTGAAGIADGTGNTVTFQNPFCVAASSTDLYVTDWGAGSIRRLHLTGSDPSLAANWTVSTLVTGLAGPAGVAVSGDGTVYVAEANANRIRQVNPTGAWTVIAGGGPEGNADGYGNTANWALPYGLAWTPEGLVVTEYHTQRVRWLRPMGTGAISDPASWQVLTLAGDIFATGTTDGNGSVARFNTPKMVASDGAGRVAIADGTSNTIRLLELPQGVANPTGPLTPVGADAVTLSNPDGTLANADGPPRPYLDYHLLPSGLLPGQASSPQPWQFLVPSGVTAFTFTVMVEGATSTLAPPEAGSGAGSPRAVVSTLAGQPGTQGLADGVGPTARFGTMLWVACDAAGNVFVSDNDKHCLRRVGRDGSVSTIAGSVANTGHADGTGDVATLSSPRQLVASRDGTVLYVADLGANDIRRLALAPGSDPRVAANWLVTTIAGLSASGGNTNGLGTVASFFGPQGLCRVTDTVWYVSEATGCRIRQLRLVGADPSQPASWQVSYVAGDNSAANGAPGTTDGLGNTARFNAPSGLAAAADGSIYVADFGNSRIRRVTPDGNVTTYAGPNGSVATGYTDGAAASALFGNPRGLCTDPGGELFLADAFNYRIRRISASQQVTTVAGGGTPNYDGPGNAAAFQGPSSVAIDASGTLYVGDSGAIRKIERLVDSAP